jgi:hypothetical protein
MRHTVRPEPPLANAPLFFFHLRTPDGIRRGSDLLPFHGVEAACCDIVATIPQAAADLLRAGIDPMRCSYLICDAADNLMMEVDFGELVRGEASVVPRPTASPSPNGEDARLLACSTSARSAAQVAQVKAMEVIGRSQALRRLSQTLMTHSSAARSR